MKNFFLMTRGRTGSTAVVDELNRLKSMDVSQEIFAQYDYANNPGVLELYNLIEPFDVWTGSRLPDGEANPRILSQYFEEAISRLDTEVVKAFGFKLLSHHVAERKGMVKVLKQKKFKAIYLTRNIPRQVLSGLVARQRGVYNTIGEVDHSGTYSIDVEQYAELIRFEIAAVESEKQMLRENFDMLEIRYEDMLADREVFYSGILEFLGLELEVPERTDFRVMIKDVARTVENYDQILAKVDELGLEF